MKISSKRISVIGLGKLGAPMAACFAHKGCPTIGLDVDRRKVASLESGQAPVFEPGLEALIRSSHACLCGTQDYDYAVMNTDVTFIAVPTPSCEDGTFSMRYVSGAAEQIGQVLRHKQRYHLVVLTSTVMPGATGGELLKVLEASSGKTAGMDFGLCYSPEFIALGSVIHDFLNPDFVLIGESDPTAGELLESLYYQVCDNRPAAARMNFVNAELTKLCVNTFVTTKISFANMIARICERLPGGDADVVTAALGLDSRIGRRYLKGSISYGGPCFPRDNNALAAIGRNVGAPAIIAEATDTFNRGQVHWLADLVKSRLPAGGGVGILGLAYKPNSEVVEESPGLLLAEALADEGISVFTYDPVAQANSAAFLDGTITSMPAASDLIEHADVIVVTTPWEEFRCLDAHFSRPGAPRIVIDCWRMFQDNPIEGVEYIPLGMGRRAA
jgi:UDPglucose 6-dehydrogenase